MILSSKQIKKKINEILSKISYIEGIDYFSLNKISIEEMAKLNLHDNGAVPFPYNKFDIRIWSNDHNPPHFHIIDPENDWELTFLIENGNLLSIKKIGNNTAMYNYIVKNAPKWLKMKCNDNKQITNQENAINIWRQNHEQTGTTL